MRIFTSLLFLLLAFVGVAQGRDKGQTSVLHLMPLPHQIDYAGHSFTIGRPVRLVMDNALADCELLSEILTNDLGCSISHAAAPVVSVCRVESIMGTDEPVLEGFEPEAYRLLIDGDSIVISAVSSLGVIRAAQTLQQLAETEKGRVRALPGVAITDWPAFKVRGFMHDVGRSFISYDELVEEIRLMSRYKINLMQWHLTERQAWRFEVKAHPELTDAASMTRFAGSYYTQQQCRAIDSIAHRYGVYVIPEIDMPGHSEAFTRAEGFEMQTPEGMAVLRQALSELMACFPHAPYLHLGGDEVQIREVGGQNFLVAMSDYVHRLGQRVIWWNPLRNLAVRSAIGCDMAQCWSTAGRPISGLPCIDCRYAYLNHFDVFADLVGIYRSNILYRQHGNDEAAGAVACVWNDRKLSSERDIIVQNNLYAVTLALGERAWLGGGRQYIEQGGAVLPCSGDDYNDFRSWEQRFLFHKSHALRQAPIPYVQQSHVRWRISDPIDNGGDPTKPFSQWEDCKDLKAAMPDCVTIGDKQYGWTEAAGAGIYLSHTWSGVVPGIWGCNVPRNQTAYAYTYIYNPGPARTVGALIEFQNYGRSERDAAPCPNAWDRKGSDIWWNGERLTPPVWTGDSQAFADLETPLNNGNFASRPPMPLLLRKGWNKVLLKLPYTAAPQVRLNKWLFTFVLTNLDGTQALTDVTYSPRKAL